MNALARVFNAPAAALLILTGLSLCALGRHLTPPKEGDTHA